jgi:hypothetical protein
MYDSQQEYRPTSPETFLANQLKQPKMVRQISSPEPDTRIRLDVYVSLRNIGQKGETIKKNKQILTQFSLNRSPRAYLNPEFYQTTFQIAKTHLMQAPPFPSMLAHKGPWQPTIEFAHPHVRFASSDTHYVQVKLPLTEQFMKNTPEPHRFTNNDKCPIEYQKMYINFECIIGNSKFLTTCIKVEPKESRTRSTGSDGDYNIPTNALLDGLEKVLQQDVSDHEIFYQNAMTAVDTYKILRQNMEMEGMREKKPQPYKQALPDSAHLAPDKKSAPTIPTLVSKDGKVRENLKIQKTGNNRQVQHTGPLQVPKASASTSTSTSTSTTVEKESTPKAFLKLQPVPIAQISEPPPPQSMEYLQALNKEDLLQLLVQQQQKDTTQRVSAHQRLGPITPPLEPITPKKAQPKKPRKPDNRSFRRREALRHKGPHQDPYTTQFHHPRPITFPPYHPAHWEQNRPMPHPPVCHPPLTRYEDDRRAPRRQSDDRHTRDDNRSDRRNRSPERRRHTSSDRTSTDRRRDTPGQKHNKEDRTQRTTDRPQKRSRESSPREDRSKRPREKSPAIDITPNDAIMKAFATIMSQLQKNTQ